MLANSGILLSKVYITDYIEDPSIEYHILGDYLSSEFHKDVEVLLVWHENINAVYLEQVPHLRAVIRYGVGYDNIDLEAARLRGIDVANTPDYGVDEVSDTALAMILSMSRGILRYNALCSNYYTTWQENILPSLKRTSESVLGVIGAGRIGSTVLIKASNMGFQTAFYDPYKPAGYEKILRAERVDSMRALLKQADIVSIHTPLTDETFGLVDRAFIRSMKEGASLINTARGKIIEDLDVLYDFLRSDKLWGIGLDVLPCEPPEDGKLINAWRNNENWLAGRLIINPHTAYYSQSAYIEMREKAALNALRVVQGRNIINCIN